MRLVNIFSSSGGFQDAVRAPALPCGGCLRGLAHWEKALAVFRFTGD
jgi:hypothetical protein